MPNNNIVTAKVTIYGTRPLWQHRFGPDAIPLEKQEKSGVAGNDPEEWRKTCMVTKEGQLYLDGSYLFATIRDGARYTKKGRGSIQAQVAATLQILDVRVLLDRYFPGFENGGEFDVSKAAPPETDPELPVYLDIRGVRNPTTKGRNVRYRVACSPGWTCSFTIAFDKTVVDRNSIQSVLNDAGKLCGTGNGRAIGMGRFEIMSFEEV